MKSISLHLLMNISVPCPAAYLQETFNQPKPPLAKGAGPACLSAMPPFRVIRALRPSMRAFHIIPENIYFHCKKNNHTS